MTNKITTQIINENKRIKYKQLIMHDALINNHLDGNKYYQLSNNFTRLIEESSFKNEQRCLHPLLLKEQTFQFNVPLVVCECAACEAIFAGCEEDLAYGAHLVEGGKYRTYGGPMMPLIDSDSEMIKFRFMLFMNNHQNDILPDHLLANMFIQEFKLNPITQGEEAFFEMLNTKLYEEAANDLETIGLKPDQDKVLSKSRFY